jgi:hypothetical protein
MRIDPFAVLITNETDSREFQKALFARNIFWHDQDKRVYSSDQQDEYILVIEDDWKHFCWMPRDYKPERIQLFVRFSDAMKRLNESISLTSPKSMQNQYKKWQTQDGNSDLFEISQRLAHSFGYTWSDGITDKQIKEGEYLLVDPNTKTIDASPTIAEGIDCVPTWSETLAFFKNPPVDEGFFGKSVFFLDNGGVQVGTIELTGEEFEQIISTRAQRLGVTPELPKVTSAPLKMPRVRFDYRGASDRHPKGRNVIVVSREDGSLGGLDMDDDFKFKKFLVNRIVGGNIFWIGFHDVSADKMPKS